MERRELLIRGMHCGAVLCDFIDGILLVHTLTDEIRGNERWCPTVPVLAVHVHFDLMLYTIGEAFDWRNAKVLTVLSSTDEC